MAQPPRETFEDRRFGADDVLGLSLAGSGFHGCSFVDCDLTDASLRGTELTECTFERCEMAMVDLTDASLRWVTFDRCRLTGVTFGVLRRDAVGLSATLEGCDLGFAAFRDLDLREWHIRDCAAHEAEFVGCNLRGVELTGTDLSGATLARNDLTDADLRGARNYAFSACDNVVTGLQVELPEAIGLLAGLRVRGGG